MYTPVNPSFNILKLGVRGSSLHGLAFVIHKDIDQFLVFVCRVVYFFVVRIWQRKSSDIVKLKTFDIYPTKKRNATVRFSR